MTEQTDFFNDTDTASEEQELSWSLLGYHTFFKIGIIALLFTWLYWYELQPIVKRWMSDSSWSHGFLIPLFSLYFLNQNKHELLTIRPKTSYVGLVFLLLCILMYPLIIVQIRIGYFRPLTMIATLGSIVLFIGGWKVVKYTWLPIAYLVFAVPLPERIYASITIPMRQLAATIATAILNVIPELEATARGVVIDVLYKGVKLEPSLDVAEACSGMRLLMAFLALGVAMAYLHPRPIWQRLVLLSSTIPIAILCNVIRVTITGFIYILGDPKYAQGIYHDGLGLLMLPLAFGFYGLLAWFMSNLIVEETESEAQEVIIRRRD